MSMKRFSTELRGTWRGARWAGPDVYYPDINIARKEMAQTPYKIVGEVVAEYESLSGEPGDVDKQTVDFDTRTEDEKPPSPYKVH